MAATGDLEFLERVFHKLMLNFTWWVNRKDAMGRNIFQGGFLGLDNIGVFDRSAQLPTGGYINQSDGTSWMAMYCAQSDAHRAGAGASTIMSTRTSPPSSSSIFCNIAEAMSNMVRRRQRRAVGRGGRVLLRRAEPARRMHACGCRSARWSG